MENLNLIEILKDAPKGTKLYSPIFGECELDEILINYIYVVVHINGEELIETFCSNGKYYSNHGECLLFPSKENRDWSTFKVESKAFRVGDYIKEKDDDNVFKIKKLDDSYVTLVKILADSPETERIIMVNFLTRCEKVEKIDPKWLKPFDRVLVRDIANNIWRATLLSHITEENKDFPYATSDSCYKYCIPFNEETKHLVGTKDDEPEFYKIN